MVGQPANSARTASAGSLRNRVLARSVVHLGPKEENMKLSAFAGVIAVALTALVVTAGDRDRFQHPFRGLGGDRFQHALPRLVDGPVEPDAAARPGNDLRLAGRFRLVLRGDGTYRTYNALDRWSKGSFTSRAAGSSSRTTPRARWAVSSAKASTSGRSRTGSCRSGRSGSGAIPAAGARRRSRTHSGPGGRGR